MRSNAAIFVHQIDRAAVLLAFSGDVNSILSVYGADVTWTSRRGCNPEAGPGLFFFNKIIHLRRVLTLSHGKE